MDSMITGNGLSRNWNNFRQDLSGWNVCNVNSYVEFSLRNRMLAEYLPLFENADLCN